MKEFLFVTYIIDHVGTTSLGSFVPSLAVAVREGENVPSLGILG